MTDVDPVVDTIIEEKDGVVEIEQEVREYPLLPQGMYTAVCSEVDRLQIQFKDAPAPTECIKLWFETEEKYKGDDDKECNHIAFSPPYSLKFGKNANLYKLCKQLTGEPPIFTKEIIERGGKKYQRAHFNYNQFKEMTVSVVITHTEYKDRTYANIEAYVVSEEQMANNKALLPKENTTKVEKTTKVEEEDVPAEPEPEPEKEKKAVAATIEPTEEEAAMKPILEAKTPEDIDNFKTLVLEGMEDGDRKKELEEACEKRLKELKK